MKPRPGGITKTPSNELELNVFPPLLAHTPGPRVDMQLSRKRKKGEHTQRRRSRLGTLNEERSSASSASAGGSIKFTRKYKDKKYKKTRRQKKKKYIKKTLKRREKKKQKRTRRR